MSSSTPGSSITDPSGSVWTIVGAAVDRDGQPTRNTTPPKALLCRNGMVYYEDTSAHWWVWAGVFWVRTSNPMPQPAPTPQPVPVPSPVPPPQPTPTPSPQPSSSDATLNSASGSIIDSQGGTWTLQNGPNAGLNVYLNGNVAGYSSNVALLLYYNKGIYQSNTSGGWWVWSNNAWQTSADPRAPSPSPVPSPVPQPQPTPTPTPAGAFLSGVNISGGEYGTAGQGALNTDYVYPSASEMAYFAAAGMKVIRVPFNLERLNPTAGGQLDQTQLGYLKSVVSQAASNNLSVILDPHNYGSAWGSLIGTSGAPTSAFANFWSLTAAAFKGSPNVIYGLMNEPNQQTPAQWAPVAIAAAQAIRNVVGSVPLILIPGTFWTGAWTWVSSGNAASFAGFSDPNFAFEVHQYLDSDGSGTHFDSITDPNIGVSRITDATNWAAQNKARLFLGEIGVPGDQASCTALSNTLAYMRQNSSVWCGYAYWNAGPWVGNYPFSVEPPAGGGGAPQIAILKHYT